MNNYPHLTAPVRLFMKMFTECMEDPSHIFLCGSRRFGYHISSSDTDITIYLPEVAGANSVQVKHELKKRLWFISQNVYLVNTEDYDMKIFGIHLFQIKELEVHIRVHHNLKDYLAEKKEHDLIEKGITPKEILSWQERKLECIVHRKYVPNGTTFYRELCRKYAEDGATNRYKSRIDQLFRGLFTKKEVATPKDPEQN